MKKMNPWSLSCTAFRTIKKKRRQYLFGPKNLGLKTEHPIKDCFGHREDILIVLIIVSLFVQIIYAFFIVIGKFSPQIFIFLRQQITPKTFLTPNFFILRFLKLFQKIPFWRKT